MSCWRVTVFGKSSAMMIGLLISGAAQAQLATAVLPLARSVQTNSAATFSASYTNGGTTALSNCQTSLASDIPATLSSFDLAGDPLAPFSLAPDETRNLALSIMPSAAFPSTQVFFDFVCEEPGGAPVEAPALPGVNVITLSASDTPTADVVALATTPSGDGILAVNPSNAFAVATINLGVSAEITVTPNTGGKQQPLQLTICETDPVTGACINPTTPGARVTTTIDANETPTFAVFATSTGTIPLDPANNRIFVPFIDDAGRTVGNTSVAVTSSVEPDSGRVFPGTWRDADNDVCFNVSLDGNRLTPVGSTCDNGDSLQVNLRGLFNTSGVPCSVEASTQEEIQLVDDGITITFTWTQILGGTNAGVYGKFEDPVLLNVGNAVTVQDVQGLCLGVWLDATPEEFNPGVPGGAGGP